MWKLVSTEVYLLYTLSDAVQHVYMSLLVDEVAMYFVSAIFISVNGCALVQFVAHDDWLEFEFLLDWKFIFAELIVFSSERAFWVFSDDHKGQKA